jgi:hypothetical protein
MRQLDVSAKEVDFVLVGESLESRQIEHLRRLITLAAKIPDWIEAAVIQDVRRMCGDYELPDVRMEDLECGDFKNLLDEDLLKLGMQVRFWLLDEYDVEWWAMRRHLRPSRMHLQELHHHVDEVLEAEPIVPVGQGHFMNPRQGVVHLCAPAMLG